ncbi:cell division protein FtsL [Paraliomyxa miuraensis]|nr:cell division protein FtsL [Paraliomyxa miuraensis]
MPPTSQSSTEPSLGSPRASLRRRRQKKHEARPHGWQRSSDMPAASPTSRGLDDRRRATPAGTSLLLTLVVGVLTAIGIARVHATTRVLELGAEITELTAEQANLLDQRRRLAAERAYLRHPTHIGEVARNHLQMIPMSPDLVQTIRLQAPEPPTQSQSSSDPSPSE